MVLDVGRVPLHQRSQVGRVQALQHLLATVAPQIPVRAKADPPAQQPEVVQSRRVKRLGLDDVITVSDRHRVNQDERVLSHS